MTEAKTNIVSWQVGDVRYDVDLHDFDGLEWRAAKQATGSHQEQIVLDALRFGDFDAIAALIWLWRRRDEPSLTYEDVLASFSYRVGPKLLPPEDGDAGPPGEGGDSSAPTGP